MDWEQRSGRMRGVDAVKQQAHSGAPGKRTLTEDLAATGHEAPAARRPDEMQNAPVQRQGATPVDDMTVKAAAARGMATPSQPLPHASLIQRVFGRHDISGIQSHVGPGAAESARTMGASGYASGIHVVLGKDADLFTEAHEAAHVVQQRAGVRLKGGVGEEGDEHERHADAVASRAVQGASAEDLLDQAAGAQRIVATGPMNPHQLQRKATPPWSGGPTVERKSATHSLAEYVGWLRQVEAKYGGARAETVQRLRRLYYSNYTGGAGPRFDAVIQGAAGASGVPISSADVRLDVLNGLYETNAIATPNGSLVDVSHILAGLDVHIQGPGIKAGAGELRFDVNFEGVLTWVGDLASWFVEAKNAVIKRQQGGDPISSSDQIAILLGLASSKVAKDDLLGDVDAQAMANRFTTTTILPPIGGGGMVGPAPILTAPDMALSDMLIRYYGGEPPSGAQATGAPAGRKPEARSASSSRNRFQYFVAGASPRIPHQRVSDNPLTISLAGDAPTQIREHIYNTARMFIDQGYFSSASDDLETYANLLDEVTARFVKFLTTGLAAGDAPWP
jgi:hypothetical protein